MKLGMPRMNLSQRSGEYLYFMSLFDCKTSFCWVKVQKYSINPYTRDILWRPYLRLLFLLNPFIKVIDRFTKTDTYTVHL
jgi:hypothetical protein